MLVLSRFPGEQIHIGRDIIIRYVGMRNGAARIAIQAPPTTLIMRQELLLADEQARVDRAADAGKVE